MPVPLARKQPHSTLRMDLLRPFLKRPTLAILNAAPSLSYMPNPMRPSTHSVSDSFPLDFCTGVQYSRTPTLSLVTAVAQIWPVLRCPHTHTR